MHRKANPAADFYRMQSTGRWSESRQTQTLVLRHSYRSGMGPGAAAFESRALRKPAQGRPPDGKEKFLNAYA